MAGIGEKLRERAIELGLTDVEIARRVGLSQSRYANYVLDKREPDFGTLRKICSVLRTTPNFLLGYGEEVEPPSEASMIRKDIHRAALSMDVPTLLTARAVVASLAETGQRGAATTSGGSAATGAPFPPPVTEGGRFDTNFMVKIGEAIHEACQEAGYWLTPGGAVLASVHIYADLAATCKTPSEWETGLQSATRQLAENLLKVESQRKPTRDKTEESGEEPPMPEFLARTLREREAGSGEAASEGDKPAKGRRRG